VKVAMVTAFPRVPDSPRGGVEAVSVPLARALSALEGLELHVVTTDAAGTEPARSTWNGVTVHRLPRRRGPTLTDAIGPGRRQVSQYLRGLAPDVVHAHDVYGLMVKGLPLPRVLTIHGFIYGDTLVSGERLAWARSRIWRWVETAGWAEQPHIISISPYVRERLAGIATGVIHDIDNPVAESFFHVPRRERKGTILSAALIEPRKNTLALVEAAFRLASGGWEGELRLAGRVTNAAYGRQVEQRIGARGLTQRVKLLGPLPTADVQRELAAASVFALASLEENSPLAIEEAMAAGVPVVTSNRCGMPYMVRDGESGFLVDPSDPGDIAGRLRQLLDDDGLRSAMGETSQRIAGDRFHPERVARRTLEVYRRAREATPRAPTSG